MNTFFTSDPHLGHPKVAALRGFASAYDHDEAFAEAWTSRVKGGDIVYVLGDVTAGGTGALNDALFLLDGLPGRKRLILGNHDRAHPMYRDSWRWQEDYLLAFEGLAQSARIMVEGREVLLGHFPYERDRESPPRHTQWRLRDEGLPLLHGHTHTKERLTTSPRTVALDPTHYLTHLRTEVHVGLDAWDFSLVSSAEVADLLDLARP